MVYRKPQFGLTLDIRTSTSCEKCNISLSTSIYQEKKIAFCIGRKAKYLCIQCALLKSKHSKKSRVTLEDIDNFLSSANRIENNINRLLGGKKLD